MGRNYLRKTERGSWSSAALSSAITEITAGKMTIRAASVKFGVPKSTLSNRLSVRSLSEPKPGRKPVLSSQMEQQLSEIMSQMGRCFYSLSAMSMRKLAFQYAEINNVSHNFNKEQQMAGKDWLRGFLKRFPNLNNRTAESGPSKGKGFNVEEIKQFFDDLERACIENDISDASRIYNVDETCVCCAETSQIMTLNAGRELNNTVIVCVSATGVYLAPMFVFKRKNRNNAIMNGAPPSSMYAVSESGWSDEKIFIDWLEHFISLVGASISAKVLLILDNHSSHCSIGAWNLCKANGVVILALPPRAAHLMQPLVLAVFHPLKNAYDAECDFQEKLSGKSVMQCQVAEVFARAYATIAKAEKAVEGFRATGISPIDRQVFVNEDFQRRGSSSVKADACRFSGTSSDDNAEHDTAVLFCQTIKSEPANSAV